MNIKKTITGGLIATTLLVGGVIITNQEDIGVEDTQEVVFQLANKEISLVYTDDNSDEDIIILTDKKEYTNGLTSSEIYFTLINNGDSESVDLSFLFQGTENIEWIKKYEKKSRTVYTPVYEDVKIDCGISTTTPTTTEECYEKVKTGTTTEEVFYDTWETVGGYDLLGAKKNNEYKLKKNKNKKVSKKVKRKDTFRIDVKSNKSLGATTGEVLYKAFIRHERNVDSEFFIEVIGDDGSYGHLDPWLNSSWLYRQKLTIDNTKVDADLIDYPIYIDLSDMSAGFFTHSNTNCTDLRITKSDGDTEIPVEIVNCDLSGSTGEVYTKTSLLDATDVDIYVYYGNSSATLPASDSTYGSENVYNSDFLSFYHLGESSGSAIDSTSNSISGTFAGSLPTPISAQIGNGQDFDGTGDYISIGTGGNIGQNRGKITTSFWYKSTDTAQKRFFGITDSSNTSKRFFCVVNRDSSGANTTGAFNLFLYDDSGNSTVCGVDSNTGVSDGNLHKITIQTNGSTATIYIDGVSQTIVYTSQNATGSFSNFGSNFYLGAQNNNGSLNGEIDGILDEMYFHAGSSLLSSDWISTEYNNQNSPSTFYSVGSEETEGGGTSRRIMQIN